MSVGISGNAEGTRLVESDRRQGDVVSGGSDMYADEGFWRR